MKQITKLCLLALLLVGSTHVFGAPEDLNGTVLFLLSDMSNFITGICIPVDGGYSAFGGV